MAQGQYGSISHDAQARLDDLRGRRLGVVGLGREGIDLVRFLAPLAREIVVSDRAEAHALEGAINALEGLPVRYRLGEQTARDLLDCDEIFVSPGVPRDHAVVAGPAAAGVPLSSATGLLFDVYPGPVIGITGSSGKTTTTSIVAAMLREAGVPSMMGGNIGIPMLGRLAEATPDTWCVLELSSFQLADVTRSPQIAVVLNIFPDHLDRHADMADYIRAKGNIVRHQRSVDTAILNADDPVVRALDHVGQTRSFSLARQVPGAWLEGQELWLERRGHPVATRDDLNLLGLHNVANALAALVTAETAGCPVEAMVRALRSFQPVPHRLEIVHTVGEVTFINDSIATTPGRAVAALRAIDGPIVLIAGGRDKHVPMDEWAQEIVQRVRAVVLVGEAAPLIRAALATACAEMPIVTSKVFHDAVRLATEAARPGDTVILSPGCTSFDEFSDYAARGEAFRRSVREFARSTTGELRP